MAFPLLLFSFPGSAHFQPSTRDLACGQQLMIDSKQIGIVLQAAEKQNLSQLPSWGAQRFFGVRRQSVARRRFLLPRPKKSLIRSTFMKVYA
ncbi:MAG: hypothetical protein LC776_08030 [Acidobacteria bacterium]|nr:hypothetical protein [Acidobacteriota bacterium]